jgi:CubicO group peptidase (beta-lactamase class C family)
MVRFFSYRRGKQSCEMKTSILNWLGALSFALVVTMPVSAQNPMPSDDAIRKILEERVAWKKLPGIVVGTVDEKGKRIVSVGKPTREGDGKLDGDSVFEIGSATKVFTALLLAEMAERGEVSLDDPISKFLPKSVTAPTRDGKEITLRHLAQHTSGLPRLPDNFAPKDPNNPYADYSVEQLYEFLAKHKLARGIGEKYEYSNLGTGLLGHLLALKAGEDYEALVIKYICEPLGMNDTRIVLTPKMKSRLATGHDAEGKATGNWDLPTVAGAGALRSTANDLLKFLAANFALHEAKLSAAMHQTHSVRAETDAPKLQIALGWHVRSTDGGEIFWHDGGTGGYRSFIGFDKKKRRGVVVLTNSAEDLNDIGMHLLDETLEPNKPRVAVTIDPKILDAYVGQYQLAKDFILTVRKDGERLLVQATGQGSTEALPESETKFFSNEVNAQITFVKGGDGRVTHLVLHQGGDHEAKKISDEAPKERPTVKVNPQIYEDYVGSYQLVPGFIITVTREGDKLMAQATAQPKFEIFPESEAKFFYKVVDAQITFVKDKDGKVTHLILHQGGDREAKKIK